MPESVLTEPARIIGLEVENFKRIVAAQITCGPDDHLIQITGPNGAGKSSFIDAIEAVLGGGKSQPPKPVRDGARRSRILVDFGSIRVERTHKTDGKTSVKVIAGDGARYTRPQEVLEELYARVALDPIAFYEMDGKARRELLAETMGLTQSFAALEVERAKLYNERRNANAEVRDLGIELKHVPEYPSDTPAEPISVAALTQQLKEAEEYNRDANRIRDKLSDAISAVHDAEAALAEARSHLEKTQAWASVTSPNQIKLRDVNAIHAQLATVEERNQHVTARNRREAATAKLRDAERRARSFDQALEQIDIKKDRAVSEAPRLIDGLDFSEDGLIYRGQPLEQASQAEQLEVSMALAMAQKSAIRIVLIRQGSLLDAKHLAFIANMAQQKGYQVWIERVRDEGGVGVFIEEGWITSIDGEPMEDGK